MTVDINQFVGSCDVCQEAKDPIQFKRNKELLHSWAELDCPWLECTLTFLQKERKAKRGTNTYSLWWMLSANSYISDKEAKTIAAAIVNMWICRQRL